MLAAIGKRSYIAISGQTDDVCLGIDRSSLGILWQQYEANKVNTDYGHCHPTRASRCIDLAARQTGRLLVA